MSEKLSKSENREPRKISDATNFDEVLDIIEEIGDTVGEDGRKHTVQEMQRQVVGVERAWFEWYASHGQAPLDRIAGFRKELEKVLLPELRDKLSEILYVNEQRMQDDAMATHKKERDRNKDLEKATGEDKRKIEEEIAAEHEKIPYTPEEQEERWKRQIEKGNRRRKIMGEPQTPYISPKKPGFLSKIGSRVRRFLGQGE